MGASSVGDDFKGGALSGKGCSTSTKIGTVCDYEGVEPDGKWSGAKLRCDRQYTKHFYNGTLSVVNTRADWALEADWQWYL
jgi:hypothetical protein